VATDAQLPWRMPVMQAPLGPAASPELVAAVSAAGGIGCLGASWTQPQALREQIRSVGRSTDRPFCVNLVLAFNQAERLEVVAEEGVALVSFSWGVEAPLVARAHAAGCLVLGQVASAVEALAAVRSGCDVVVAQGVEAGGHVQGETGLLALIGDVCRTVDVPVIAAGGIAGGDGARAAMAAGASGIAMGTRFLATPEADVHPEYAERLVAADSDATVLTYLFDGGWPAAAHRVLRNSTYAAWELAGRPASGERPGEGETVAEIEGVAIPRYAADEPRRGTNGDIEAMCLYAGRGVGLVTAVESAAELVERIGFELARPG
jgi:nitronate monooxygenase